MQNIFEVKDNIKCVCKDFEVIGDDGKASIARKYLKALKLRLEELGLTYNQCRSAALKVKHGDFEGGLKTIWKNKVKINITNSEDGYTSTKEYDIPGYAIFTEKVYRANNSYMYTIDAEYKNNQYPSSSLKHIADIQIRKAAGDIDLLEERAVKDTFINKPAAAIYNFLFVCYDDYDMGSVLNRFHLRLKNKFTKQ